MAVGSGKAQAFPSVHRKVMGCNMANTKFNSSLGYYKDGTVLINCFDDALDVKVFVYLSKRRARMLVDGYCRNFNYTPRKSNSAAGGRSLYGPSGCLKDKKCRSAIRSKSASTRRSRECTVKKQPRRSK